LSWFQTTKISWIVTADATGLVSVNLMVFPDFVIAPCVILQLPIVVTSMVGVMVTVGVLVLVYVKVIVGVRDGVLVNNGVGDRVGVGVWVGVLVGLTVGVNVYVGVLGSQVETGEGTSMDTATRMVRALLASIGPLALDAERSINGTNLGTSG
jgi:hypothetical protein